MSASSVFTVNMRLANGQQLNDTEYTSQCFFTSKSFQSFLFVFQTFLFFGHRLLVGRRRRNDARLLRRRRRVFRRRRRLVGRHLRLGVNLCENFRPGAVVVVAFEQQLARLFVQR